MTLYDDVSISLSYLSSTIRATILDSITHNTVIVNGLDRNVETIRHLAVYTVATVFNAFEANLRIADDVMEYNEDSVLEVKSCFNRYIGESNNYYTTPSGRRFISNARNPWLAEVIVHLLLNISATVRELFPPGLILTTTFVHDLPTDNGVDAAGIYSSDHLGVVIVECKAYKTRPSAALTHAAGYFANFDTNYILGKRIRTHVQTMRAFLPEEHRQNAINSFWKNEKSFMPTLFFDSTKNQDWTTSRTEMGGLSVDKEKRVLIPINIDSFKEFFDDLADAIRDYLGELLQNV